MTRYPVRLTIDALISRRAYTHASYNEAGLKRPGSFAFRRQPLFVFLLLVFASFAPAGEEDASGGNRMLELISGHGFEIIDVKWDDFSFKVPVPVGESHKILRGEDIEGGENFTVAIYRENIGYLFLSLSTRSLTKDYGKSHSTTKFYLLYNEYRDQINDIFSRTLIAKDFIPKEFKRIKKVCDLDNALIYQSEVLCDFDEYTTNILASIGTLEHQQYSFYFVSFYLFTNTENEWDKYFRWNTLLAELQ